MARREDLLGRGSCSSKIKREGGVADAEEIQIQKGFVKHYDGNVRVACCRVPYGM